MQTPKSILLHLDSSPRTVERIKLARQLADAFDAEVIGLPCTMSALMRYPLALEGAAEAMVIMRELDETARARMHEAFVAARGDSPRLRWMEAPSDSPWGFVRQALYADLMILGQRDDAGEAAARELPVDFLPNLLIGSGRPALVLPRVGPVAPIGRTVLVAWKETPEAAHAVSAALPWLCRAAHVHAVCFGEAADASLNSLQAYLEAQGVNATLYPDGSREADVGSKLLSMAADLGADLLVMGCYGHSRAREWVLGGATRSMLGSMTLPVLMSH